MKLTIKINLDNAAFDGHEIPEIQRICETVCYKLFSGNRNDSLLDINGNTVGNYRITTGSYKKLGVY